MLFPKMTICLAIVMSVHCSISPALARIITVDDDAPADFTTIQAAINDANDGDTVQIQPGTYSGNGNRDIDFLGKAITVTSTDPNDPNTVAQTIIDENGKIFLFQNAEDANSVLDGLTIIHVSYDDSGIYITGSAPAIRNCVLTSNATGWSETGRAIWCEAASSPTIESCLFTDNAADRGGAIYCIASTITATDCVFRNNWATERTGGAIRARESKIVALNCTFQENHGTGGAISLEGNPSDLSEVIVRDCVFIGNTGLGTERAGGGALTNAGYKMTVTGSLFAGNWSAEGGAILNAGETAIKNCLFVGNSAEYGGALCSMGGSVNVLNSTFAGNYSEHGNSLCCSVYGLWGIPASPSAVRIRDSIVWDGPDSIAIEDDSTLLVAFCDITGTVPGYGNIDADPCFVDPGYWVDSRDPNIIVDPNHDYASWVNGDYHVKSQARRWNPNSQSWTQDDVTSPCIDAGDPNSPLGSEPFPNGGIVNMGVYGGTAEASKPYFGKPPCETNVGGDINGDCVVNGLDLSLMGAHWLGRAVCPNMPSTPNPADHGEDVPVTQVLTWRPSCEATSYKVYFGTDSPGDYQGEQEMVLFDPGTLEYNATYYWHIVESTPEGSVTSPTWTFQTPFRRDSASNPDPCDGEIGVSVDPLLTWTAAIGAESHDVYFGDTDPPEFQGNQVNTDYEAHLPPECNDPRRCPYLDLEFSTRYYWRIDEVNPYGTTTGALWTFRTGCPPSEAGDPNPANDANDVGASAVLSWTADVNATSQEVYFGTADPPAYQGSQTETTFAPASLAPATTYYWRIDQVNSFGTTTGEVWTFTTGTTPPGQATDPSPADDANNLDPGIVLSWSPGSDALAHDVYFGTTSPGTFKHNQAETTYNPGGLSPGTTYYWRIDEVGYFGTTTGAVWTFTTGPLPEPPTGPDPTDGTMDVGLTPILSWTGGAGAESYDVYFGTMSDYRNRGNQTETTFDPGTLSAATQYYWRIGEINVWGTTYGPEWTFTTQAAK